MEFIGGETAYTYLLSIYCTVKPWIQRNEAYNQIKMCMCVDLYIWSGYMVEVVWTHSGTGGNMVVT
jgi:hypothetical protein